MKKIFFILLSCLVFIACGNDDNLQLSKDSCKLTNDSPYIVINIKKGTGPYKAKSSNENVAQGFIEGDMLLIYGISIGNATITVIDQDNNSATVKVTINEAIIRPAVMTSVVFIKKGITRELLYPLTPGKNDYMASDDENIATAAIKENKIIISGNNIGETDIYLAEMIWARHVFAVKVVDVYDLIIKGKQFSMYVGEKDKGFSISCGNGDYEIIPSDDSIISYEVIPYVGDVNGIIHGAILNPVSVVVKGLKAGTAQLTITDKEGKTDTVDVTVR